MVLPSQPLPDSRLLSSGMPCGWMNRGTPSSSALAQTGMEFRVGEVHAVHRAADRGALQALLLHRGFELLHGEIGRLQGKRGKGREAIRLRRAEFGELLVLHSDDLRGKIALAVVPERIDRQDLHVHGLRVHGGESLTDIEKGLFRAPDRPDLELDAVLAEQRAGFAEMAMRVHVDGLTRLPLTITGNFWRAGCWPCALRGRPQPQKTMPVATAAVPALRKSRRVVMTISSMALV